MTDRTAMNRRYVTVDVFTQQMFSGNPLAVVLDSEGLTSTQMQAIATEFNYSETSFVLPPREFAHTARVRIFTATTEIAFAGHPSVGTAVVLAQELESNGSGPIEHFIFEEAAGLVPISLLHEAGSVVGAELRVPERLSVGSSVSVTDAAACLSLSSDDISIAMHAPQVISVGLPFMVTEVKSREALRRSKPDLDAHQRVLPPAGTDAIFAYTRGTAAGELHARAFAPLDACLEDPATGSAAAATISLLASLSRQRDEQLSWRIEQGVDMGRPSVLLGRTDKRDGKVVAVYVSGHAVPVMQGMLRGLIPG